MIYQYVHIHVRIVFHNKSNEITSLWPVLSIYIYICILYMCMCTHTYICVVSSRRNKTNPYHRNKIIPVLYATQLQACKPKLSTYDQLLTTNQQAVSLNRCVRKLKHFQPHSLLCQLWCESFHAIDSFENVISSMMIHYTHMSSRRSSFDNLTNLLFLIIHNLFHTAKQLFNTQSY